MNTYTTFRTISRCMRDHGSRELLRAAKAAEEAERLDSVPTFRTMRELEEYDRRQREQTANHVRSWGYSDEGK